MVTDISVPGANRPEALEALIRDRATALQASYKPIEHCRVVVKVPHRHRRFVWHFQVRIEITVQGGAPIVLVHEPSLHRPLKDAQEAVDQAFKAAAGRLRHLTRTERVTTGGGPVS
jgi:hypothetical protein